MAIVAIDKTIEFVKVPVDFTADTLVEAQLDLDAATTLAVGDIVRILDQSPTLYKVTETIIGKEIGRYLTPFFGQDRPRDFSNLYCSTGSNITGPLVTADGKVPLTLFNGSDGDVNTMVNIALPSAGGGNSGLQPLYNGIYKVSMFISCTNSIIGSGPADVQIGFTDDAYTTDGIFTRTYITTAEHFTISISGYIHTDNMTYYTPYIEVINGATITAITGGVDTAGYITFELVEVENIP